jgi:hypothetical protein
MKQNTTVIVALFLMVRAISAQEDIKVTPTPRELTAEDFVPELTIDQAIAVAREFVKTNQVDVSGHYMSEVRYVLAPEPRHPDQGRKDWVVVWSNPRMFRDDIVLFVGMKREVIKWVRRGRQQPIPLVSGPATGPSR